MNKPVWERIKRVTDAQRALGQRHRYVIARLIDTLGNGDDKDKEQSAFLSLRVVVAALNEGWVPKFTDDEYRYYPTFRLFSKDAVRNMDAEDRKIRCVTEIGNDTYFAYDNVGRVPTYATPIPEVSYPACLLLRNEPLACYCGRQFIDLWKDLCLPLHTGE